MIQVGARGMIGPMLEYFDWADSAVCFGVLSVIGHYLFSLNQTLKHPRGNEYRGAPITMVTNNICVVYYKNIYCKKSENLLKIH